MDVPGKPDALLDDRLSSDIRKTFNLRFQKYLCDWLEVQNSGIRYITYIFDLITDCYRCSFHLISSPGHLRKPLRFAEIGTIPSHKNSNISFFFGSDSLEVLEREREMKSPSQMVKMEICAWSERKRLGPRALIFFVWFSRKFVAISVDALKVF